MSDWTDYAMFIASEFAESLPPDEVKRLALAIRSAMQKAIEEYKEHKASREEYKRQLDDLTNQLQELFIAGNRLEALLGSGTAGAPKHIQSTEDYRIWRKGIVARHHAIRAEYRRLKKLRHETLTRSGFRWESSDSD